MAVGVSDEGASAASKPALAKPVFVSLSTCEPEMAGYNLKVQVMSCKTIQDRRRPDGTRHAIVEAVVADPSACCTLTLRGDQVDLVKPGDRIILRNAKTVIFDEHMRLCVDPWGRIVPDDNPDMAAEQNLDNDLSAIAFELVQN
ncbi:Single-stranded DNA binding protein Ssb-like OB fold domain-containing protein [Plasmodiophora brassicae]|uniref:Single-stranded DNA binding protein Ssb-like OB fold domain-containing protein n=1 Tax=Plasmodiophora brassicae TaxID=37360 RepID=A0A0G4IMY7_PLABS|nr:hypothetical protein PBRA_005148 [Plasmodiophora brassicae]